MRRFAQFGCKIFIGLAFSRYVLALVFSILTIVPLISVQMPLSLIYKRFHDNSYTLSQAKQINTARYEQAQHYFRHLASGANDKQHHRNLSHLADSLQLVICIITVDRSHRFVNRDTKMGYLLQTTATVDHLVRTDRHFPNTTLFVCNVQGSPETHREAKLLRDVLPFVERYGSNSFKRDFQNVTGFVGRNELFSRNKEMEDYIYCLNASYTLNSPFILMLEDDIILEREFFEVLHYTLTSHNMMPNSFQASEQAGRKFSFLKLYYPTRWQGYAFELDRMIELLCVGFLGGAVLLCCVYMCCKFDSKYMYSTSCFYFILGTALAMYCSMVIGRQNMIELRRLSPQLFRFGPAPGCCTPAMLYPRDVVPGMISYLMANTDMNKDLAISAFTKDSGLPGYHLEPNLVYHIGMYTSLKTAYKPPEEFLNKVLLI